MWITDEHMITLKKKSGSKAKVHLYLFTDILLWTTENDRFMGVWRICA